MLSDFQLTEALAIGVLQIEPRPEGDRIQPASIDLTLSDEFMFLVPKPGDVIDPTAPETNPEWTKRNLPTLLLPPQRFCLARTRERVSISSRHYARAEGKSTLGRCGLFVHVTAGYIDPGFTGTITLELFNANCVPIRLTAGMKICQLAVGLVSGNVSRPYGYQGLGSHYQGQFAVTPPR